VKLSLLHSRGWLLLVVGFLVACVTVNIYFPAAAAEKAADRIIEDVWRQGPAAEPEPTQPPASQKQGRLDDNRSVVLWERVLNILISSLYGQEGNINIDTPSIRRIKNSMAARYPQLKPFYENGTIGLTQDGLVAIRDLSRVPLKDRNRLQQLVREENNDRNRLYQEIAQANGRPDWAPKIRDIFAQRWIANASPGWWYQTPSGGWRQK
jgi:uncharacterized protein YdbL (DUF1318 family)